MLYWFLHVLLGPIVRLLRNPVVEGLEHVPEEGPAILASNHLSFSDSIFLPLVLPRRIWFPAKLEYFTKPGVKGKLTKAFFKGTGQIPIDRAGGNASENALRAGLNVLRQGGLFGIYPEGTRSPDGRLHKGKTGVARLALEGRVPVIPVAMIDTDKFQPTGQLIPNLSRVGIRFGEPLDFSRYEGMANDRAVLRAITDEIMYELARLSGREYVDEYAATRKAAIAAKAEEIVAKAEEIVAAGRERVDQAAAKAEEIVVAGRERVDQATAKAEEIVAAGRERVDQAAAKAEEIVAAGKERVDTVTARAEGIVAATKQRTHHRIDARHGGGRDRAIAVADDPRDISPLRALGLIPKRGARSAGDEAAEGTADAAPTEVTFARHLPASAEHLAMQEEEGDVAADPTPPRAS